MGINLINFNELKKKIYENKIIIEYQLTNRTNIEITMKNGIQKGAQLYILKKSDIEDIINMAATNGFKKYNEKNGNYDKYGAEVIVIVSIPDTVHKQVYGINEDYFPIYKEQFDYENDENGCLNDLSLCYAEFVQEKGDTIINYYIPPELILGYITFDSCIKGSPLERSVFIENQYYFEKLSVEEQKSIIEMLKKTYWQGQDYSKYCSLVKKRKKNR